jgi:hypothetical protein
MNLTAAKNTLQSTVPPRRGEVVLAVLVVLAHARRRLDDGDERGARALARQAELGFQCLRVRVLEPLVNQAQVAGLVRDRADGAVASIRALDRLFSIMMRAPKSIQPTLVERMTPEGALGFLTRLVLDLDAQRRGPQ